MKQVQIVGGRNGQNIVLGVPGSVKDLPCVVQVLNHYIVSAFSTCSYDFLVAENLPQSGHVPRCFVAVVLFGLPIKYSEEVVVSASNDFSETKVKEQHHTATLLALVHHGPPPPPPHTHTLSMTMISTPMISI